MDNVLLGCSWGAAGVLLLGFWGAERLVAGFAF